MKPAFGGGIVAEIISRTKPAMATVRNEMKILGFLGYILAGIGSLGYVLSIIYSVGLPGEESYTSCRG